MLHWQQHPLPVGPRTSKQSLPTQSGQKEVLLPHVNHLDSGRCIGWWWWLRKRMMGWWHPNWTSAFANVRFGCQLLYDLYSVDSIQQCEVDWSQHIAHFFTEILPSDDVMFPTFEDQNPVPSDTKGTGFWSSKVGKCRNLSGNLIHKDMCSRTAHVNTECEHEQVNIAQLGHHFPTKCVCHRQHWEDHDTREWEIMWRAIWTGAWTTPKQHTHTNLKYDHPLYVHGTSSSGFSRYSNVLSNRNQLYWLFCEFLCIKIASGSPKA